MLWLYFTSGLQYANHNQVAMWPETELDDVLFQSLPLYSDVESEIHRPPQHEKVNVSVVKGPLGFGFSLGEQRCEIHNYTLVLVM